ncbi:type II toxin-antitoxin system TacA family antitoxin [Nocardiopsis akebiae]|uniref:type II toxin-antitoxin system TacA family antitoxin n=1 Tax=Nocardiopsis akebiae TaxID=2831968 RepID=UPI002016497A|nr:DUF1778 domain-containing protein [Nocardiopsis akebiae]
MSTATERIEVRLTPEDKDLLLEAARISHGSDSEFVVRVAREAAEEVVQREQTTTVPAAFFDAMVESLARGSTHRIPAVLLARPALHTLSGTGARPGSAGGRLRAGPGRQRGLRGPVPRGRRPGRGRVDLPRGTRVPRNPREHAPVPQDERHRQDARMTTSPARSTGRAPSR